MSAEVAVKKRGRPKKVVNAVLEEIIETPKKPTAKRTTKAKSTTKKLDAVAAEKPVKFKVAEPTLPKKLKSSVLEEIKKLEASKAKTNPAAPSKSTTETSPKPISPSSLPGQPFVVPAAASASNSEILKEVKSLSKKIVSADEVLDSTTKTTENITTESTKQSSVAKGEALSRKIVETRAKIVETAADENNTKVTEARAEALSKSDEISIQDPADQKSTQPATSISRISKVGTLPADQAVAKISAFKTLQEGEAISADQFPEIKIKTIGKTAEDSITKPVAPNTRVLDTSLPIKEAAVDTTASIAAPSESTMAKTQNPKPYRKGVAPSSSSAPQSSPKIPIAQLNSKVVSDLSARGGARPIPRGASGQLPTSYKPLARTVTKTIVALPIFLVTSYVLYERLALREDQRLLTFPSLPDKDSNKDDTVISKDESKT